MGPLGLDPVRRWARSEHRNPAYMYRFEIGLYMLVNNSIKYQIIMCNLLIIYISLFFY